MTLHAAPPKPLVSPKLRESARGRKCALRWAAGCDDETVVLCHIRGTWSGVAQKPPDYVAVFACAKCHDCLDGRAGARPPAEHVLRALVETQMQWVAEGLLKVGGMQK